MSRIALLIVVLAPLSLLLAKEQITGTITEIADTDNNQLFFFEINNYACQKKMMSALSSNTAVLCYTQKNYSEKSPGPVLVSKRKKSFLDHDDFGKDLAIGAALCGTGCVFVLVAGSPAKKNPEGFYATVGEKQVTGGLACVPATLWGAGCLFLSKGIIEIFKPNNSDSYYGSHDKNQSTDKKIVISRTDSSSPIIRDIPSETSFQNKSTKEIIAEGNFRVISRHEKTVNLSDSKILIHWMERYCLSL